MKKYYKLLIIPCVIVVISLYFIGIDVINRTDSVDDPTQKAAEVAHYLYGVESDNGEDNGGETGNSEQNADNSASEPNGDGNSAKNQKSDESAANENSNPPELKNNSGKVNINTATKEELTTLDGIGEKYAERIIETRERRGGFTSIEQITEVKGIGQKRFEKIKDEITVGEPGENK